MCTLDSQPGMMMLVFAFRGILKTFMPQVPIEQRLRFDCQTSSRLPDVFVACSGHWQAKRRHQYSHLLEEKVR